MTENVRVGGDLLFEISIVTNHNDAVSEIFQVLTNLAVVLGLFLVVVDRAVAEDGGIVFRVEEVRAGSSSRRVRVA